MPPPLIKICGLNTPDSLDAAIKARADYAGFVFFPRSPRHLELADAQHLADRSKDHIRRVGLFVDPDDNALAETAGAGFLDAIQLHGEESPERCARVRAQFNLPVWKALSIAGGADLDRAAGYRDAVDLILFDAKTPKGTLPGGMGLTFDWSLLTGFDAGIAWGLAGGLNPNNVADAIRQTGTPLVDTSSGVECAPGVKDVDKIDAFCKAVLQC